VAAGSITVARVGKGAPKSRHSLIGSQSVGERS
jgi:hypothetical protein